MLFPFVSQLVKPEGFWVHAHSFGFAKRFGGAYRTAAAPVCGPSDINGNAPVVVTPAEPGSGVRIPINGGSVSTLRKPARLEPVSVAKGSLSSDSGAASQDTLKTGVSTPALGVASHSRVVGNGASCISSSADSTGRGVSLGGVPRNAGPWRQVGLFLDAQHLASLGLRMLP